MPLAMGNPLYKLFEGYALNKAYYDRQSPQQDRRCPQERSCWHDAGQDGQGNADADQQSLSNRSSDATRYPNLTCRDAQLIMLELHLISWMYGPTLSPGRTQLCSFLEMDTYALRL
jgi:hypothetical protein